MSEAKTFVDQKIDELKANSSYVATSYRLAPDELTALKQSLVLFAESNARLVKAVHELRQRVLYAIHVGGDHFDLMCKFDDLINMMK